MTRILTNLLHITALFLSVGLLNTSNFAENAENKTEKKEEKLFIPGYLLETSNGTVLDKRFNRIWQKCSYGQRYIHSYCSEKPLPLTWKEAENYCNKLELNLKNWRVPTLSELESIMEVRNSPPSIYFEIFSGIEPYEYWSSDSVLEENGLSRKVYSFYRGYAFSVTSGKYFIRCVKR